MRKYARNFLGKSQTTTNFPEFYGLRKEALEDIAANNLAKYKVVQKVGAELHIEIKYFFQFWS